MKTTAEALAALPRSLEDSQVLQIFTEKRAFVDVECHLFPWCCAVLFKWEWVLLEDEGQCVAAVSPEQEWDKCSWVCSIGAWFFSHWGGDFVLLFVSYFVLLFVSYFVLFFISYFVLLFISGQVVYVLTEGGWESLPCSPFSGAGLHRQLGLLGDLESKS